MEADIHDQVTFNIGIIVIFVLLMIFMLFEAWKNKYSIKFGHEASLVCSLGLVISAIFYSDEDSEFTKMMEFNGEMFFYFVLPPIVFAAGFNMYRKKFFENLRNIVLFGVFGTFTAFAGYTSVTLLGLHYVDLTQHIYSKETGTWTTEPVTLLFSEVVVMCALICSTDVIAAVSVISAKKQAKLFSVAFGEGIINDAVSIILFNTVISFARSGKEFNAQSVGFITMDLILLMLCSLAIGLIFGIICALTFKYCRSLTKNPVVECAFIFLFAYLSYIVSEMFEQSGIVSLLVAGIVIAHYAWYSLSHQGRHSSNMVFEFVAFIATGFIFSYLGLTFFSYKHYPWSIKLFGIGIVMIMIGRAAGTLGLYYFLRLCGW